ncbi:MULTISPECIES: ATP-binding protein [unclassified Streptomyces]|uniref:ATP-binding protein n=1 Tax=unclassified Streptomyces TaxID=2593676 RepID=UPI002E2C71F7|nr:ATP-binding protein [Streptomyces sp. NBC_01439]
MNIDATTVPVRSCGNRYPTRDPAPGPGAAETVSVPEPQRTAPLLGAVFVAAEKNMVREVRHFTSSLLAFWGVAACDRESALLIVGELGANAAQYGGAELAVRLSLEGVTLRIDVRDGGALPWARAAGSTARPAGECGRGLTIVDHLADRLRITTSGQWHMVRADLRLTPPAPHGGT